MSLEDRHRSITVRGLIAPTSWNSDDEVRGLSLLTFDDDEYEILVEDAGRYLLEHLREEVLIRGHLMPEYRKRKVLRVRSFTVVGPGASG